MEALYRLVGLLRDAVEAHDLRTHLRGVLQLLLDVLTDLVPPKFQSRFSGYRQHACAAVPGSPFLTNLS